MTAENPENKLTPEELIEVLEPVMRRIVREELAHFFADEPNTFGPDSPLYEDLLDIKRRAREGKLKLLSYGDVFGE